MFTFTEVFWKRKVGKYIMRKKNKKAEVSADQAVLKEEQTQTSSNRKKQVKKKKKRHILLKIFAALVILALIGCIAVVIYVGNIIKDTTVWPDLC